jgi:drug/metabolite transporter (DMT)-like permease
MATTFLLLSVVFSTLINLIFRWFKDFEVNKFQAIVVNYLVCFLIGFALSDSQNLVQNFQSEWFPYCILLGFLFVAIFFSMALTTEKLGISVTAVSGKMSVVIPVIFAFYFFKESIGWLFIVGLMLSLLSIYLISIKKELVLDRKYIALPIIVFLGSGIIDTSLKMLQNSYSQSVSMDTLSYSIFLGAFLAGSCIYLIKNRTNLVQLERKSITAGILLGLPNYFSIFFLLSAIAGFSSQSALVLGVNNIGVVLFSTFLSVIIFKEKLSNGNTVGLVLALLSIAIIAYAA